LQEIGKVDLITADMEVELAQKIKSLRLFAGFLFFVLVLQIK